MILSRTSHVSCTFVLVVLLSGISCNLGNSDLPDLGRVTGKVTLDGRPLTDAMVTFQPSSGRPSVGRTDTEGQYVLDYMANQPGAKVGSHQVMIRKEVEAKSSQGETIYKETLSPDYNQKTTLTAEVQPGPNDIDFSLSSS